MVWIQYFFVTDSECVILETLAAKFVTMSWSVYLGDYMLKEEDPGVFR